MTQETKKSIREQVLGVIEDGSVSMRPKWHFVIRGVALGIGVSMIILSLLYLISFIIFIMRQNGVWFLPEFGLHGIREFLLSLPWLLIALAGIFILLLEILVRRYSFAYRRPLVYSVIGIAGLVLIGGFIVAQSRVHEGLFEQAEADRLPLAGPLYRQFGAPPPANVVAGTIAERATDGFVLSTRHGEQIPVIITPQTRFPGGTNFAEGERVVVFGQWDKGIMVAFGVRTIDGSMPPMMPIWHIHFESSNQ